MKNIIIIVIIAVIVGLAAWYVYKAKKSGNKCIGCPEGCSCSARNTGCACSCCEHKES